MGDATVESCASALPTRWHDSRDVYLHSAFHTATHVYVRHESRKSPLMRPYDGPFIFRRFNKH